MKTWYVANLPEEMQARVLDQVECHLLQEGIRGDELAEALERASNSRLCDLEEVVDINEALLEQRVYEACMRAQREDRNGDFDVLWVDILAGEEDLENAAEYLTRVFRGWSVEADEHMRRDFLGWANYIETGCDE